MGLQAAASSAHANAAAYAGSRCLSAAYQRAMVDGSAGTRPPADAIGWRASLAAGGLRTARLEVAFAGHDLDPCRETAIDGILSFLEDERR